MLSGSLNVRFQGQGGHRRCEESPLVTPKLTCGSGQALPADAQTPAKLSILRTPSNSCLGDHSVTDLNLVCEFAPQKLIDEPCDFRFIAEESTQRCSLEYEGANTVLGDHGSRGRLLGQKGDLTNEVAFLQVRDLTTGDSHSHMARANEE